VSESMSEISCMSYLFFLVRDDGLMIDVLDKMG